MIKIYNKVIKMTITKKIILCIISITLLIMPVANIYAYEIPIPEDVNTEITGENVHLPQTVKQRMYRGKCAAWY